MEAPRDVCTLIKVTPPMCHRCGKPLRSQGGYIVRVGPSSVLLESEPIECRRCGTENYVAKVLRSHHDAVHQLEEIERHGVNACELGSLESAIPRLVTRGDALIGERRSPDASPDAPTD